MYPDRATFQRMVNDEENLSSAGRETILALYDGPLHLKQILEIVNAKSRAKEGAEAKDRIITESALRKRLEVLIARGIIARAGSERTNPYYFIRRPWIFNQYILIKCRDRPKSGLLDLTVLIHELSQMADGNDAALPHPRYLSATGERTERGHQIGNAYDTFQKLLGNKTAVGDYLEGIYEDIYKGKVPESDIDGLLARDFLRFVATAPDEEREARFFLWYADFFHILDRYGEAYDAFRQGIERARGSGLDLAGILAGTRISKGHFLVHLNDFAGAKEAFLKQSRDRNCSPFTQAAALFGLGEVELLCGETAPPLTSARFSKALDLCTAADPAKNDPDVQELRADLLRRTGTVHRLAGRFDEAESCYHEAEEICRDGMIRGLVWLMPEKAELLRARAFGAGEKDAEHSLAAAAAAYDEARTMSQRIRNVSWYAHSMIGECELARIAFVRCRKPLPKDLATKYANAFEIYCQISSKWGLVQTFLSQALLYHTSPAEFSDQYAVTADKLEQAERFSKEMGLRTELALIRRIKMQGGAAGELNPLMFL